MEKIIKQATSFILPISVIFIIPYLLEKDISPPILNNSRFLVILTFSLGAIFIFLGSYLLIETIRAFIRIGKGTLAPWSPTGKLIVEGLYAHVRNPMITGVIIILLGESLILLSYKLFIWFIIFFLVNNIYFKLIEEPGLLKRFGKEYEEYKRNVPKWIPRLKPWKKYSGR